MQASSNFFFGLSVILSVHYYLVSLFVPTNYHILFVPKRITIRLSASIAFKIVNQSEYALGL